MTWLTRLLWLSLPLTLGDLIARAVDDRSAAVGVTVGVVVFTSWAAGLLASLVRATWALLVLRLLAPTAVLAGVVAAVDEAPRLLGWVGLTSAVVVSVAVMTAEVGYEYINGASYGDEARFPLRPPAALLVGPIGVVWALTTVPLPTGMLLFAARLWIPGAALMALGALSAWWGVRVLARLTRRWCVLVPAGVTLVDDMALAEPTLMRAGDIVAVGPAPADTTALDLTAAANGLMVQIDLNGPGDFLPVAARGQAIESVRAASILIAPSRPGALIRATSARSIGVERV